MTILLIQRASIDFYPPILNQANIIAESGLTVKIIDGGTDERRPKSLQSDIELFRPLAQSYNEKDGNLLKQNQRSQQVWNNIRFIKAIIKEQKKAEICTRIGYDSPAIVALGFSRFSGQTIYHFHEHPEAYRPSLYINLQHKIARYHARHEEMIIVPDKHRAIALQKEEHLSTTPYVVPNCPRPLVTLPTGRLRSIVHQQRPKTKYIALFQGSVSKNYYLDNIIKSIPWWPEEVSMVFIGPVRQSTKIELTDLAREIKVEDRLLFLSQVDYSQIFNYTVDADIAFCMIKPVNLNYTFVAGASNKRYEFMACGIPQISNTGPGMKELIEENRVGICVDPQNIELLGRQVKDLILNEHQRKKMGERARALHLQKYNYDLQFDTILTHLLKIEKRK